VRDGEETPAYKANDAENQKKANKVVSLIKPRAERRQACKDALAAVEDIQDHSDILNNADVGATLDTKERLRRFAKAVADVEYILDHPHLVPQFPFPVPPSVLASIDEVLAFGRRCAEIANAPGRPANNKEAKIKRRAVGHAFKLMETYDPGNIVGTEDSKFCRLAELLFELQGGEDRDPRAEPIRLTSLCAAHIRAANKKLKSRLPK
jgi:hypothetical protein